MSSGKPYNANLDRMLNWMQTYTNEHKPVRMNVYNWKWIQTSENQCIRRRMNLYNERGCIENASKTSADESRMGNDEREWEWVRVHAPRVRHSITWELNGPGWSISDSCDVNDSNKWYNYMSKQVISCYFILWKVRWMSRISFNNRGKLASRQNSASC